MNTLPAKWYIPLTPENYDEVKAWWLTQVKRSGWQSRHFHETCIALSVHPIDDSYYWIGDESHLNKCYPSYKKITLEQFRQITNPNKKPMTKSIQISRELLNEYYDAATTPQREYLAEHFKLDGTTTDEAIRGLYDLACSTWKPHIKKNHPECFEDEKHFDFSAMADKAIVEPKVAQALGLSERFIEVRYGSNPKTRYRSFYLSTEYNWELVNDNAEGRTPVMVLIPTKK